jgi:hypothetical protein
MVWCGLVMRFDSFDTVSIGEAPLISKQRQQPTEIPGGEAPPKNERKNKNSLHSNTNIDTPVMETKREGCFSNHGRRPRLAGNGRESKVLEGENLSTRRTQIRRSSNL